MTEGLFLLLLTGLGAGAAHVYLGVDHLAALLPVAHGKRTGGFWLGIRWGLGHSIGVIFVAVCFLAMRETAATMVDFEGIGVWGERLVGVFLIGLGVLSIRAAQRQRIHTHEHLHDGEAHHHLHVHTRDSLHDPAETASHESHALHGHASFIAGVLHGVAGMSHLWVVLPSLALSIGDAGVYLTGFGAGALISMGLFGAGIGFATAKFEQKLPHVVTQARYATAGTCMVIGGFWLGISIF